MGVKNEVTIAGGATVTPGRAYVIFHASVPNPNGIVRICPIGQTTAAGMATALGYSGAAVAPANVAERAAGAFTGPLDTGASFID